MDEIDKHAYEEVCRALVGWQGGFRDRDIETVADEILAASGLTSKLAALEDENKTLREAVNFYADRKHWRTANSPGGTMNDHGFGLGFHQTGDGQMEILAANCGHYVASSRMVHGGHWQADAGHIARAALSQNLNKERSDMSKPAALPAEGKGESGAEPGIMDSYDYLLADGISQKEAIRRLRLMRAARRLALQESPDAQS